MTLGLLSGHTTGELKMNANFIYRRAREKTHLAARIFLCGYMLVGCGESTLQSTQRSMHIDVREEEQTHEATDPFEVDAVQNDHCDAKTAHIEGEVIDESGPLRDIPVLVCPTYASGVKLCLGPIYTDEGGQWQLTLPPDQGCITKLSVRASDPSSTHPALSCHISAPSSGTLSVGRFYLPTLHAHGDAQDSETLEVGPMRLTHDGDETSSNWEMLSWATIEAERLPGICRFENEVRRIAVWPDGPANGVAVTTIDLPDVPSGTVVALHLIGGLYSMTGETLVPEGTLHELGRAYVEDGVAEFDLELDNFGWFLVSTAATDGENN